MIRQRWVLAGAAGVIVVAGAVAAVVSSGTSASAGVQVPAVNTASVERGSLATVVSQAGTLTYRARPDGSPYLVFNRARGTYTELPESGETINCGNVLYRVDNKPVLLLCGPTPAYRSLSEGDKGPDVAELNADLVDLGYATRSQVDPSSDLFGSETVAALEKLQSKAGESQTGSLAFGQAVFLPGLLRVAAVSGQPGGSARPGAQVVSATSATLEVQVSLDPLQQDQVNAGDRAEITLPDNRSVAGTVERLGRVAEAPAGQNTVGGGATLPAYISLDQPQQARGLDQAPVQVEITTKGVRDALNVPVTAIVGNSAGGFAVEVVAAGGQRRLVAVKLGLYDTTGGRVQVDGDLRVGERVAVGSS
jgi:hypothetical protein